MIEVLEPCMCELVITSYEGDRDKIDDCYSGNGSAVMDNDCVYNGQFQSGMPHGIGIFEWPNGVSYEGDFVKGTMTGKGVYKWPDGSFYEGHVDHGLRHGLGIFTCSTDQVYEGEWKNGKRHGKGRLYYNSSKTCVYEGYWVNGLRHYYGIMKYSSGNMYEGEWVKDKKHGKGVMTWSAQNEVYLGEWVNDLADGFGEHIWGDKALGKQRCNAYRGAWKGGLRSGLGTFFYSNGSQYSGYWVDNKKDGRGAFTFPDGRIIAGSFKKDRMQSSSGYNRSADDVNPQYRLNISDLLECIPDLERCLVVAPPAPLPPLASIVESTNAAVHAINFPGSPPFPPVKDRMSITLAAQNALYQCVVTDLERVLLRYNAYTRMFYRRYLEYANNSRANDVHCSPTTPAPSNWTVGEKAMYQGKNLHSRLFCMTLSQLKQFAREIGLVGTYLNCYDVSELFAQMKQHHRIVTVEVQRERKENVDMKLQIAVNQKIIDEHEGEESSDIKPVQKKQSNSESHNATVAAVSSPTKAIRKNENTSTPTTPLRSSTPAKSQTPVRSTDDKPSTNTSKLPATAASTMSNTSRHISSTVRTAAAPTTAPVLPHVAIEDGDADYEIINSPDIPLDSFMDYSLIPAFTSCYGHENCFPVSSGALSSITREKNSKSVSSATAVVEPDNPCKQYVLTRDVHIVDRDPLSPVLEREFVEFVVRISSLYARRSGTTFNSPSDDVKSVLATRMLPLSQDWDSIPAFVSMFYNPNVQLVFTDYMNRWKCIWYVLVLGIVPSDTTPASTLPHGVPLRKFIHFLLTLNGSFLVKDISVEDILKVLNKYNEIQKVVKKEIIRSVSSEDGAHVDCDLSVKDSLSSVNHSIMESDENVNVETLGPIIDYSVLSSHIDYDDFLEFISKIFFHDDLWNSDVVIPRKFLELGKKLEGNSNVDLMKTTVSSHNDMKSKKMRGNRNSTASVAESEADEELDDDSVSLPTDDIKLSSRLYAFITMFRFK